MFASPPTTSSPRRRRYPNRVPTGANPGRSLLLLLLCLLGWLLPASPLRADDVERYVDEDGVVHLSIDGSASTRRGPGKAAARKEGALGETRSVREERVAGIIAEAASYYGLPVALVRAVIRVESNYFPRAVSPAGALGLMQLMPATAQAMFVRDPFDPRENIFGGCRFLRMLLNRFDGDLVLTLAAYNAGEGAVLRRQGVPYSETAGYVRAVLQHFDRYRRQELAQ